MKPIIASKLVEKDMHTCKSGGYWKNAIAVIYTKAEKLKELRSMQEAIRKSGYKAPKTEQDMEYVKRLIDEGTTKKQLSIEKKEIVKNKSINQLEMVLEIFSSLFYLRSHNTLIRNQYLK